MGRRDASGAEGSLDLQPPARRETSEAILAVKDGRVKGPLPRTYALFTEHKETSMSPQPYVDTEPELPERYECSLCGVGVDLVFGILERTTPTGIEYVAGYRCIDREACRRRQEEKR